MESKLRVAVYTFGCKVNLFESEQLKRSLENIEIVDPSDDADYYVINGCTVTAATDSQVRNMARRFSRRGKVVITGCYARKDDPHLEKSENIVLVRNMQEVAALFERELIYRADFHRARPFIKVQDGCDQFCTYCIIPHMRGGIIKSTSLKEISELLDEMVMDGFHEVVLTGIHLGKYGAEEGYRVRLADVVSLAADKITRVRLGSIEPIEIDESLVKIAEEGKLLPHWHIPLQSGSDTVLERMGRPYKTSEYLDFVEKIFKAYSNPPAIGTDVIVGFPGETDEEFEETFEFVKSIPFAYGHVFPFSPREGTPAWDSHRKTGVDPSVQKERAARLRELFKKKKESYLLSVLGTETEMILEERLSDGRFRGTTSNYLDVTYSGEGEVKDVKSVRIERDGTELIAVPL